MFATFTLDSLRISNTRSLHNDTDFVYISATVGANPPVYGSKSLGNLNNGTHSVALSVEADIPDDDTTVVFTYVVFNNGHGHNDVVEKAVQTALSSIGEEVVKHTAATATAVTIGAVVVPFLGSALIAVSAILGVAEVASLLFADCDGVVAAGTLRFTCSELVKKTKSGQKITETANHNGTDSPHGCGSNSQYSTTATVQTAPSIQTVIDLKGKWASGGVAGPFISVTGNSISIDMSAAHRPTASGSIVDSAHISVKFPDDKAYTAVLQPPNVIKWSNNAVWTKVPVIATVIDLNGQWAVGGVLGPVITVQGNSISINMAALKRPTALGTVVDSSHISVNFPDDRTYTAVLQKPGTIQWSSNSTWAKFDKTGIKHLFVLMLENRAYDHLLGFSHITGTDAQTGLPTKAEGLTGAESNVYESQTFPVTQAAVDRMLSGPNHQFNDVLVQLCGPAFDKKELNGSPYPTVNATGYAAAYGIANGKAQAGQAMACFSTAELPIINALASEFVLCDHWFSAMAGPTEPNRMFVHAATCGPWDDSPSNWQQARAELGGTDISFPAGTIYDRLRAAKVPFRIYAGDLFPNVGLLHGISIHNDIDDFSNFQADINSPDFDAAYTFIEPSYDALVNSFQNGDSQHPLGSVRAGEQLIKQVYENIRQSPLWNASMLIVTWDEHGGFYDHVLPPRATPTGFRGQTHGFMFDQHGPRVPAIVISPWCRKNLIEHRTLEHSAVPATIEQLFGLKPLTVRDEGLIGLQTLATLQSPRQDAPLTLPVVGAVAAARERAAGASVPSTPLEAVTDTWPFWLLRIAVKHHLEAAPSESATILGQVRAMKTLGDLNEYSQKVGVIVKAKQQEVRRKRLAARPARQASSKAPAAAVPVPAPGKPTISASSPHDPAGPID
jgi:phospholipase C